jgi:hypothetical protein
MKQIIGRVSLSLGLLLACFMLYYYLEIFRNIGHIFIFAPLTDGEITLCFSVDFSLILSGIFLIRQKRFHDQRRSMFNDRLMLIMIGCVLSITILFAVKCNEVRTLEHKHSIPADHTPKVIAKF